MKRIVLILLGFVLLVGILSGCEQHTSSQDQGSTQQQPVEEQKLEKFAGEIKDGTPFSEGLAIISDGQKTYCINKNGGIVYEIDVAYNPTNCGYYERGYQNGLVKIGDNLYDKTGKETKPADVGVTKFYDYALSGGYIVAKKEEATYNSTKTSVGILNTKFEWVVPLSEDLYKTTSLASPSMSSYAIDGYILCMTNDDEGRVFEVTTSKYFDFANSSEKIGEYSWTYNGDYWNGGKPQGNWVNGKRIIQFYNDTAKKYFFALINANGELEFEPIELPLEDDGWGFYWEYDGRYVVAQAQMTSDQHRLFVYDTLNGTSQTSTNAIKDDIIYSDGVVANYVNRIYPYGKVSYYDMDLNPLF